MEDLAIHDRASPNRKIKRLKQWNSTKFPPHMDSSSSTTTSKSSSSPFSLVMLPNQHIAYRMPVLELSSSRQTIHISTVQTATFYSILVQKFLVNHHSVDMTGLENAIVIAMDTANLLQRQKVARIIQ